MALLDPPYPFGLGRRTWPLAVLAVLAVVLVALPFDYVLAQWSIGLPESVRSFFFWITDVGLSEWVLVPSLVLLAMSALLAFVMRSRPRPHRALVQMAQLYAFIFLAVGVPGLLANIAKRIVGRARPEVAEEAGPFVFDHFINDWTHQSFVSGHAATIFAVAFVVGFLSRRWFWPALAVAVLVGVSRVVVGAHYPSDVIGGAVIGTLGAYAVRSLFASRRILFERRADGSVRVRPFAAVSRLARRPGRTTR